MKEFIKRIPILFPLAKLARYWIRRVLWSRRLKMKVGRAKELKIVIGASGTHQEDWIPTDIEALNLLKREDWERYFKPGTVSAMLAEHVWEHMTPDEGIVAAKFCFEYLKPGGHLRVAVPDGLLPNSHYIEMVKAGGSGPGADDHKILFTCRSLQELFESTGFRVELLEYYTESEEFVCRDWDPTDGLIHRSKRFANKTCEGQLPNTSIILDARK